MKNKINLSIVVPCFNEAANLPLILERFGKVIDILGVELILVNNGSTDNSAKILGDLLPNYPFARSVLVKKNKGYGYGILCGLRAAKGEFLSWTHADMQTDPKDVIQAYNHARNSPNPKNVFVKGNRKRRPLFDNLFTWGMSFFEFLLLRKFLWDINAQPNLFHKSFFEKLEDFPFDFSFDLFFYYAAEINGFEIIRFPVLFPPRIHGHSKWNTSVFEKWKFIKRVLSYSFKLKANKILWKK